MTTGSSNGVYDVWAHEHVRYSDLDPNGHVNNVAIAEYVATGRVAFLEHVSTLGATVEPMALRHLTIDYVDELSPDAELRIGASLVTIGTRSFTVGVDVLDGPRLAVRSQSVAVVLENGRAKALTESTRTLLHDLLEKRPR